MKWDEVFNGGKNGFPCLDQVMTGLFNWYSEQIKAKMHGKSPQQQKIDESPHILRLNF